MEIKETKAKPEERSTSVESNVSKGKTNRAFKTDEITQSKENESDISKISADSYSTNSISIENVQVETEKQNINDLLK